jgi:hypothetical protein
MASTGSSLLPPRDFQGLPLATLVALLATMLGVSVLSSYDEEARWLRFGMLLFAVGLAMWLPYGWAALSAAALSLATAYARGGLTDVGVLRPETMLEVPGIAFTAVFAALLRRQLESLPSAGVEESRSHEASAAVGQSHFQPPTLSETTMPSAAAWERASSRGRYGVRGVRLARTEDSWAFVESAKTAIATLEFELAQTNRGIKDLRSRVGIRMIQPHGRPFSAA